MILGTPVCTAAAIQLVSAKAAITRAQTLQSPQQQAQAMQPALSDVNNAVNMLRSPNVDPMYGSVSDALMHDVQGPLNGVVQALTMGRDTFGELGTITATTNTRATFFIAALERIA